MKRVRFVGAAAVVLVLQGCAGHDCSSAAAFGLSVRLQDPSGAAVCDASVTATAGDYSEVLSAGGTAQDCVFVGAVERRGTYTVTADRGGAAGTVLGVKVRSNECHVITEKVTVKLGA
jgi:outer membrane lipoprotein SlyB